MPEDRILDDHSLSTFDVPFTDWPDYVAFLDRHVAPASVESVLDIGGGSGQVIDHLLDHYQDARGLLVDDSTYMIERNRRHPRKELLQASALELERLLGNRRFDLVTVNDLLHHLVSATRRETRGNVVRCLESLHGLLASGGRLAVYEQVYDGWWPIVEPGDVIFLLTSVRSARFSSVMKKMGANTAGVGVAFRSRRAWRALFEQTGYRILGEAPCFKSEFQWLRSLTLGVRAMGTQVFLLESARG